jgi:hypothetical protein
MQEPGKSSVSKKIIPSAEALAHYVKTFFLLFAGDEQQ